MVQLCYNAIADNTQQEKRIQQPPHKSHCENVSDRDSDIEKRNDEMKEEILALEYTSQQTNGKQQEKSTNKQEEIQQDQSSNKPWPVKDENDLALLFLSPNFMDKKIEDLDVLACLKIMSKASIFQIKNKSMQEKAKELIQIRERWETGFVVVIYIYKVILSFNLVYDYFKEST